MSIGLMTCPFCSGKAKIVNNRVICTNCGSSTKKHKKADISINLWNTRQNGVVRGHWKYDKQDDMYSCSVCGYSIVAPQENKYCPNCGASQSDRWSKNIAKLIDDRYQCPKCGSIFTKKLEICPMCKGEGF